MNDNFSFILQFSHTIEQSLKATLEICYKVSSLYKEELLALPFSIDMLSEALRSESLKETAHCRILHRILQNKDMQNSFIQYFMPNLDYATDSVSIPYPDKHRIDLTIKGDTFFLIIENKINGASEQRKQIDRYVRIAQQTYPNEQIYVLYLGGETNIFPSENAMSLNMRQLINDRIICKNYKDDIITWIAHAYKQIEFRDQPFLKSTLLLYKTYLENKYNINNQDKAMNNKLDKTLVEMLGLKDISLDEKISVIQDQIDNIDKIRERLSYMLQDYEDKLIIQNIKDWYDKCTTILSNNPILTMEDNMEFGFNFAYRNLSFRCCVSFDDNEDPYWGIKGLTEDIYSRPKIFEALQKMVLQSNKGFHNHEYNTKEWVVSDYEKKEFIVDKFMSLTHLICGSESCTVE